MSWQQVDEARITAAAAQHQSSAAATGRTVARATRRRRGTTVAAAGHLVLSQLRHQVSHLPALSVPKHQFFLFRSVFMS